MFFINHVSCLCAWFLNPGELELGFEDGQWTLGRLKLGFVDNKSDRVELRPPPRDLLTRPLGAMVTATSNEEASCTLQELLASFPAKRHSEMFHREGLLNCPLITSLEVSQIT